MAVRMEAIPMACRDERKLRAFWSGALGYEVAGDQPGGWMVPRDLSGTSPSLGLQAVPETKVGKHRVHLDLVPTKGQLETEIQRLEDLGARRVRHVENDPDESHGVHGRPGRKRVLLRAATVGTPASASGGITGAGTVRRAKGHGQHQGEGAVRFRS